MPYYGSRNNGKTFLKAMIEPSKWSSSEDSGCVTTAYSFSRDAQWLIENFCKLPISDLSSCLASKVSSEFLFEGQKWKLQVWLNYENEHIELNLLRKGPSIVGDNGDVEISFGIKSIEGKVVTFERMKYSMDSPCEDWTSAVKSKCLLRSRLYREMESLPKGNGLIVYCMIRLMEASTCFWDSTMLDKTNNIDSKSDYETAVEENGKVKSEDRKFTSPKGNRTLLSQAYRCEDAWAKRLESPLLKDIKMDQYFVDIDKKFNTKNLASGIDIDLFAINVQNENQLDELEHLLYRFRRTKRAWEMMDSTICAVVRIFLKSKNYEALFRILKDTEYYGIFPDLFSYNILLDTFIEEKMLKEATQISILMMLQEDFSNEISSFLAVYSCYMFMKNESLDSLKPPPAEEAKDEDDEEVLVRVPFFRNPWFDDHFDLTEPRHLIGKTFFLAGRQMKNNLLSKTFQLLGLGMYEKWGLTLDLLNSIEQSEGAVLLSEGVEEFKKYLDSIPNEETKAQIEALLIKLQDGNKILSGNLEDHLNLIMSELPAFEKRDIKLQEELFNAWEQERQAALHKQNLLLDKQQRLEAIAQKKEYLIWKEKLLFFFENEEKNLEEFRKAQEITAQVKESKKEDEQYIPPEVPNQPTRRLTKYQRLSKVKIL